MKFSVRQILASAAGAVLAALIASSFGVTGTIIGVAIGSAAATFGTALVAHSIERGQQAVKQVAVRVPEGSTSTLLRRLGGTGAVGAAEPSVDAGAPTEVVSSADDETTQMNSIGSSVDDTRHLEISAVTDAPSTERLEASTTLVPPVARGTWGGRRFTWSAIAGTAAIVFVLALGFVTAVELIAGKPLSSIFGGTDNGPSIKNIFTPSPATNSTTTTTSTSTPSSTTTTSQSSTTSTTNASTTTTTTPTTTGLSGTTTTTNVGGATTTTTPGSGTTTTTSKP